MTAIPGITNFASASTGTEKPLVQIAGNQQWLDSLTAGQILKGRIMRHYGDSRYGVSFSGQERIVDSAVPLSVGEILTGKVVGLAERSVHMQIVPAAKQSGTGVTALSLGQPKQEKLPDSIEAMMGRSGLQLDQLQLAHIAKASRGLGIPELAVKIGFFAAKHGLPVSSELIRAIYTKINEARQPVVLPEGETQLDAKYAEATKMPEQVSVIEMLQQYLIEYGDHEHLDEEAQKRLDASAVLSSTASKAENVGLQPQQQFGNEDSSKNSLWDLCYAILLNAQTGAAYQHKFKSLPIIVNDKLIEFDLALFDHGQKAPLEGEVQTRYLKFSLTTEFGVVTLDASVLNNRVHLQMASNNQWLMKEFSLYQSDLTNNLRDTGWILETVDYESEGKTTTPAEAVIHHVLEQDSLSVFV